ncbi:MAG TPA: type I glyceraldehyde-3-phosphate dehydrogenase [Syntrophales bacterium]|nr:type I glyceraldehyde-3-phosphate dehydrogenase [Syntrophales bacterium]
MGVKVAINGFGRVGRSIVRACSGCEDIDIIAVNSRAKPEILVHLLKYDSVHGKFKANVSLDGGAMVIDGKRITITTVTSNLADLPWSKLGVEMVLESTGRFRKKDEMTGHLTAGAKKVILAAPGKGVDGTFVMGVNEEQYNPGKHHIVSNASCTTNCLAPVAKVLNDEFKIVKGFITTAHAYTMDQRLLDGSHNDLRRARAAAISIVPTSTGAAQAVGQVIPDLKGKLDGVALRVPVHNVSIVDLVVEVSRPVTVNEVNGALKAASEGNLKDIMLYCEEELVSVDFTSSPYSAIVDAPLTNVIAGTLVKVFAWYDNEIGYACRMRDLAIHMARKGM